MKTMIEIVGDQIGSSEEFHLTLKNKLKFPDYYGMNPDALWDCLTDALYSDEEISIRWTKFAVSTERLGKEAILIKEVLLEAHKQFPELFDLQFED